MPGQKFKTNLQIKLLEFYYSNNLSVTDASRKFYTWRRRQVNSKNIPYATKFNVHNLIKNFNRKGKIMYKTKKEAYRRSSD